MADDGEYFFQSGKPNATENELGGGINTVVLGQFDATPYYKYYNYNTQEFDQDGPSEDREPVVDLAVRTRVSYFETVVGGVFFMTNSSGVTGSKINIGASGNFFRSYDVTSEVVYLRVQYYYGDDGEDYSVLPTTAHIHAVAWFGAQRQDGSVTDPRIEDWHEWYSGGLEDGP